MTRDLRMGVTGLVFATIAACQPDVLEPGKTVQRTITSGEAQRYALDLPGGKIYWTDYVVSVVRRANLTGTGIQLLYQAPIHHNPRGIALDLPAGKVYWGQDLEVITTNSQIMRMNLDGSVQEVVARSLGLANYLVIPAASASRENICARARPANPPPTVPRK